MRSLDTGRHLDANPNLDERIGDLALTDLDEQRSCYPKLPKSRAVSLVSSTSPPNQIVLHRPVETAGVSAKFGAFYPPRKPEPAANRGFVRKYLDQFSRERELAATPTSPQEIFLVPMVILS